LAFYRDAKIKRILTREDDFQTWTFDQKDGILLLPRRIKHIDREAFGSSTLVEVNLPDGVTMGYRAFAACRALTIVRLPADLKKIPDSLFRDCRSLKEIELPTALKEIGNFAFCECRGLSRILLPARVRKIGDYAFSACDFLRELSIGDVDKWGKRVFGLRSRSWLRILHLTGNDWSKVPVREAAAWLAPDAQVFSVAFAGRRFRRWMVAAEPSS
jgi:hypothetical protein